MVEENKITLLQSEENTTSTGSQLRRSKRTRLSGRLSDDGVKKKVKKGSDEKIEGSEVGIYLNSGTDNIVETASRKTILATLRGLRLFAFMPVPAKEILAGWKMRAQAYYLSSGKTDNCSKYAGVYFPALGVNEAKSDFGWIIKCSSSVTSNSTIATGGAAGATSDPWRKIFASFLDDRGDDNCNNCAENLAPFLNKFGWWWQVQQSMALSNIDNAIDNVIDSADCFWRRPDMRFLYDMAMLADWNYSTQTFVERATPYPIIIGFSSTSTSIKPPPSVKSESGKTKSKTGEAKNTGRSTSEGVGRASWCNWRKSSWRDAMAVVKLHNDEFHKFGALAGRTSATAFRKIKPFIQMTRHKPD